MLSKTVSFFLILLLGVIFRKTGCLSASVRDALTKILIYVTLPSAILVSFSVEAFDRSYLWIIAVGFFLNLFMIGLGLVISRGQSVRERVTACLSMTGYSIGSFALPFTQAFLPGRLLSVVCLFDFGNALMTLGGTSILVSKIFCREYDEESFGFFRKLLSSPSLIIELIMINLLLLGCHVPDPVVAIAEPLANANFFLSFFLVGSLLRFDISKAQLYLIGKYQIVRILYVLTFSMLFYMVLPFERDVVLAVILASCSPISIMSTIYVEQYGGDSCVAGLTGSINVFFSIIMMFLVLAFF